MMIEGATIQVPFLADLVTMADPTSPFSFLNWLKQTGRLYPFYIRESFYPLRAEYDAYCRWAARAAAVPALGSRGRRRRARRGDDVYVVRAMRTDTGDARAYCGAARRARRRHRADVPAALRGLDGPAIHSSDYLHEPRRAARGGLDHGRRQRAVGGGDLPRPAGRRREGGYRLDWITRSPRFFPMEYTKLTLEMTSPEYTDHFHALPLGIRQHLGREQRSLYKGISGELIDEIYDTLYRLSADGPVPTTLLTDTEVTRPTWDGDRYRLRLRHGQLDREHERETDALVLATGYAAQTPAVPRPGRRSPRPDALGRLDVARDYSVDGGRGRVFVQNGEEHTHGLTAPDLGFGAWRNSSILASIIGREVYPIERRIAFQDFGVPADAFERRARDPGGAMTRVRLARRRRPTPGRARAAAVARRPARRVLGDGRSRRRRRLATISRRVDRPVPGCLARAGRRRADVPRRDVRPGAGAARRHP